MLVIQRLQVRYLDWYHRTVQGGGFSYIITYRGRKGGGEIEDGSFHFFLEKVTVVESRSCLKRDVEKKEVMLRSDI
jgi:hypothetical protein